MVNEALPCRTLRALRWRHAWRSSTSSSSTTHSTTVNTRQTGRRVRTFLHSLHFHLWYQSGIDITEYEDSNTVYFPRLYSNSRSIQFNIVSNSVSPPWPWRQLKARNYMLMTNGSSQSCQLPVREKRQQRDCTKQWQAAGRSVGWFAPANLLRVRVHCHCTPNHQ